MRIVSQFQHDGPYPLVSVVARYRFGGPIATELRNFSLLPGQAGCEHPERAPLYLDNLVRLGLAEMRPVRVSDDTRSFGPLEASPEVKAAVARVEARPPLESAAGEDEDRVVADLQRRALYVTSFGRQFYEACEYRPEAAR